MTRLVAYLSLIGFVVGLVLTARYQAARATDETVVTHTLRSDSVRIRFGPKSSTRYWVCPMPVVEPDREIRHRRSELRADREREHRRRPRRPRRPRDSHTNSGVAVDRTTCFNPLFKGTVRFEPNLWIPFRHDSGGR